MLGALDMHETVTDFAVAPFVGLVAPGFRPVLDRAEVDEVFEVPLAFVLDPANLQVHGRRWQGHFRRYYVIALRAALHLGRHRADAEDARGPDAGSVTRIDGGLAGGAGDAARSSAR